MNKKVVLALVTVVFLVIQPISLVQAQTYGEFLLQRWATQQGALIDGMLWFDGDFNGDGRQDLATVWNDAGQITIDVQASTGTAFELQRWATQQGALIDGMLWFVGDFSGDGKDELAVRWNDAGQITIDVHASTGTAFELQRWATQQGALIDGMLWFDGDFNGDGRQDLATVWNDAGQITIDVQASTGTAFELQRWATQQGALIDGMLWFAGDFNGDGRDDLATLWNDAGQISMDVHVSTGTAFTNQRWATQQGSVISGMLWFVGDFSGDGKDELAVRWNDAGKITIDVHASTGTAFELQRWATQQGALIDGMLWFVGDFSGDGKDELAVRWNDAGKITIDVHVSTGSAFDLQRWATQQGALIDGMLWFAGDYNGDRAADLADRWNDANQITIDVFAARVTHGRASQSGLVPAVIYVTGDEHIHEIVLKGTWQHRDLTAAAGAPLTYSYDTRAMAFRRSDGVSMVVYLGKDNHIHSLYLELVYQGNSWQEVWHWADLSAITGSPAAASNPYGYVRSDGISTVVYAGSDGHIHELRLEGGWIWADLTAISVSPLAANGPIAYVRGDGINAIVYVAAYDGHICELRLDDGWKWADLTAVTLAPLPMSALSAYVRSDGISTINYTGYDGHIHEIRLETSWIWADLTLISGAPGTGYTPFGYVRSDGINAIVYATGGADPGRVYELWLGDAWQSYELTSVPHAVHGYGPFGYVRADGLSAVVYRDTDWHIHEIRLDGAWRAADLTSLAGAPLADGFPWVYNRSTIVRVHLPIMLVNR